MANNTDWKALQKEVLQLSDKHATETGRVISAWNLLQDVLGRIFADIANPGEHEMAFAIWYSQDADRSQRKMLTAAAKARFGADAHVFKELKWICDRADSLSDDRNNVAHVGYSFDLDETLSKVEVKPRGVGHYARADHMSTRDIFAELKTVERNCKMLLTYTLLLSPAVAFPEQFPDPPSNRDGPHPWPDRPELLKSKAPPTPRQKPSRGRRKSHQRPPQSSQG